MADIDDIINKTAAVHLDRRELADPPPDSSSEHSLGAAGDPEVELSTEQIYVAVTKPKVEYLNPENQVCGRQRAASNSDRPRASSCPASRPYVPITEETKAELRQEFGEFADMIMVLHQHNMPVKMYGSDCHAADILKAAYRFNAQRHVRHVITERVDMMLSVEAIRSLEDVGSMVVRAIHLYLQLW